jgi:predicted PurR-regulated permease PerM
MERVDDDLTTIYTGNLITIGASGLLAVVVYYGLDLIAPAGTGVQFPILLGLLTGVATLIPSVGMKIVYVPYTAYLVWQGVSGNGGPLWFPVVFFLVTVVVVDVVPDIFIRSYFSKGELNMGLVLLMYVLGAVAFGWYGVFVAPIILVAFVHFVRDILPVLLGAEPATA